MKDEELANYSITEVFYHTFITLKTSLQTAFKTCNKHFLHGEKRCQCYVKHFWL